MRVRVTLKDPDTMQDAVEAAFKAMSPPDGITDKEWAPIRDARALEAQQIISGKFMEFGEYLVVEFDTESETAEVIQIGK